MSLIESPDGAEHSPTKPQPKPDKRIQGKLKTALDLMVWEGLQYNDAAVKAELTVRALRLALDRPHVLAYLKQQRQVLHASVTGWADFRMIELAKQDKNMAAAVSATKELRGVADQEVSRGSQHSSPGLVVIIQGPVQAKVIEHDPTETST